MPSSREPGTSGTASTGGGPGSGGRARGAAAEGARDTGGRPARKQVLLRLDPLVYEALARWAGEELRSTNAQVEFLLRRALSEAGRLPRGAGAIPRRGRPRSGSTGASERDDKH